MSVTPCDCSSLSISSLSQSTRGRHLMTPLQLFNVLCGLAVTGQPAKLSNLLRQRLCAAEAISMSRSPLQRRLTDFTVPTGHLIPLSTANGESFDSGLSSSTVWTTNHMSYGNCFRCHILLERLPSMMML